MINRLLRWYLYGRRGLGHIGAVLSGVTFVNTVYLVSRDWALIGNLSYLEIMLVGVCVLVPVLVYLGFIDYKKGFFQIESAVATEENPYTKDKFTVKELKYFFPVSLAATKLGIEMYRGLAKKFDVESPEFKVALKECEAVYEMLRKKIPQSKG